MIEKRSKQPVIRIDSGLKIIVPVLFLLLWSGSSLRIAWRSRTATLGIARGDQNNKRESGHQRKPDPGEHLGFRKSQNPRATCTAIPIAESNCASSSVSLHLNPPPT